MTARYNIALLPTEPGANAILINLAQDFFGATQDGYLLGASALPHVTLCQFRAESDAQARAAFEDMALPPEDVLTIADFHFRAGSGEHDGFVWAEFGMRKTPAILERQRACYDFLAKKKMSPLTPSGSYAPHLTLARLPRIIASVPSLDDAPCTLRVHVAVGQSDENGAFQDVLP